jgi:hypothetical protein
MAAAPQYGTFTGYGAQSKKSYSVDVYLSDVVSAMGNFDGGAGAGATSPDFYTFPEPVILTDFSLPSGMTDTTVARISVNGVPTATMIRWANFLNTLNNRPTLQIKLKAGSRLQLVQLA